MTHARGLGLHANGKKTNGKALLLLIPTTVPVHPRHNSKKKTRTHTDRRVAKEKQSPNKQYYMQKKFFEGFSVVHGS